jgi:propionyl-CoA carboxylase beta chain
MHAQPPKSLSWSQRSLGDLKTNKAEDPAAKLFRKNRTAKLFANPYTAAQRGFVDVILPQDTRRKLIAYVCENKVSYPNRKHGNIPL